MKQKNFRQYTIIDETGKHTISVPINKNRRRPREGFQESLYQDNSFMIIVLGIILVSAILIFLYFIALGPDNKNDNIEEENTSGSIPGDDKEARENPWAEDEAQVMTLAVKKENITFTYSKTYSTSDINKESWIYPATSDEVIAMARVIHNEARGQSFKGQVAVGATMLNRHFSENKLYAGKNMIELATQRSQYAYSEVPIKELKESGCIEAAKAALRGEDPTRDVFAKTGALFFYNPEFCSEEALAVRTGVEEMVIGEHHFHVDFI